jgi:translation initiation factor 2D
MGPWKRLEVTASNPVRSSDVRKLRQELLQQERRWITEDEIEQILPSSKSRNIMLVKCSSPKANLYVVDREPVLFQPARSNLYFPTLYSLWKVQRWPVLETTQEVSKFLLGGADLMLPGVFRDQPCCVWDVDQVFAVCVRGNPYPFAVGTTLLSSASANENMKGKALAVEHFFGDALWEYGSKLVPNQGFLIGEAVLPVDDEAQSDVVNGASTQTTQTTESDNAPAEINVDPAIAGLEQELQQQQLTDSTVTEQSTPADVDPDELLLQSFLQALKSQPDLPLPMDASKFYTEYVVPNRPAGTTLDLKATSFKKLGGFLKAMVKNKLIKTKDQRGAILIVQVDRAHALLQSFESHQSEACNAADVSADEMGASKNLSIDIEELFKPKSHQKTFFETNALAISSEHAMNGNLLPELLRAEQVKSILEHHVAARGLEHAPGAIELDGDLRACLQRAPVNHSERMHFSEVYQMLLSSMEAWHRIGQDAKLQRGRVKPIQVIVEDRQGGRKHITRIQRINAYGIEDQQFATDVQRRFAAAATVSEVAGSAKKGGVPDTEVTLQGSFGDEVVELLTSIYMIPKRLCEIVDKRKKRAK